MEIKIALSFLTPMQEVKSTSKWRNDSKNLEGKYQAKCEQRIKTFKN